MTKQPTYTKHSRPSGNQGKTHPNLKHSGYWHAKRLERLKEIRAPLFPEWEPHDP